MSQLKPIFDPLLTNASSALIPKGYICEELLPYIGAVTSTGLLAKYGTNHLRVEKSLRGGRGAYKRIESIARSTAAYSIEGHGLESIVTADDYRNVQSPYKAEEDEVMGLTQLLWTDKEYNLAAALASTSIVTQYTTLTGTNQYDDFLNSDPIDDFATARSTVKSGCGMLPNVAFMDELVWNKLRFHPQMLDALGFKQNRPGGLTKDEMAVAMGVEKVLIAGAVYESAKEGQTSSLASIWGKHIWFAQLPDKAAPYQVSAGYWIGYEGEQPRKVYKQNNFNPPGSTLILCEDNYDHVISNVGAIYRIASAIA